MTLSEPLIYYPSIHSTQDEAKRLLTGVHWTTDQTAGKGRFDRKWHAEAGKSLAVSLAFPAYKGFAKPYLISMWMCLAVAEEFGLKIQWPNDLSLNRKKVCGVLTEIIEGIPIVGIGINVGEMTFPPELAVRATSLANEGHLFLTPEEALKRLLAAIRACGEVPSSWSEIEAKWRLYDDTAGKVFRLHDGRIGMAVGISSEGELLVEADGKTEAVPYAEALWGPNAQ